ncbi:hypothetical protein MKX83_03950 [Cytobacillus sp. FSL M8-0252]|uniref:hypothetical protein n=1 Tax=Cytobacillus sp. FSL M8-0252 TaxID=2921621 RepID=UPI0030F68556
MSASLVYALQKRVKKERELRARGVYAQKRVKKDRELRARWRLRAKESKKR